MKKVYLIDGLDCANCAAAIERGVAALDAIESVSVSFLTRKMILEAKEEEYDQTFKKIKKIVKKTEPDAEIKEL